MATGIDNLAPTRPTQPEDSLAELVVRLRNDNRRSADRIESHAPPPRFASPLLRQAARPDLRLAKPTSDHVRPAAPRGLDRSGHFPVVPNSIEEKVLEIPAFLARKAN